MGGYMNKKVAILGSTGSIGTQALEVARLMDVEIVGLTANSNIELFLSQIIEFKPKIVAVGNAVFAKQLCDILAEKNINIEVGYGIEGISKVAEFEEADVVLNSVVGSVGLIPTIRAIQKGKTIALANKETLVTAGQIVMEEARRHKAKIIPIDSEHSAIFQSLLGYRRKDVKKIILTASGGPFRGKKIKDLKKVKVEDALKHPNWNMGSKITIDSATMMNKGLELIEARWLFAAQSDIIDVVVHPQSIVHSMVEYKDGSIIAQLGSPDKRIPIQFAFTYPERHVNFFRKLDLLTCGPLTFEKPDMETFKCLKLAFQALQEGGTMPTVLNAANEVLVSLFLSGKITFLEIPELIEKEMLLHSNISKPTIEDILDVDSKIRTTMINRVS